MNEQLRLGATFDDRATPGVKRLRQNLESIHRLPGMDAAINWSGEFAEKTGKLVSSGGGLVSMLESMGVGGLAAGASIGALVGHFKALSEHALALREMARETGLTVDQLNRFAAVGNHFGVTADAMKGAVESLAAQMPQFRAGFGHLRDELQNRLPNLTETLRLEDTQHQLETILDTLGKVRDPQQQKQLAELFFPGHGADIEKLYGVGGLKGLQDQIAKINGSVDPINPHIVEQAQVLRDEIGKLNIEIGNFENSFAPGFLEAMTLIVKGAESIFKVLDKVGQSPVGKPLDDMPAVKDVQQQMKDLAGRIGQGIWDLLSGKSLLHKSSAEDDGNGRPSLRPAAFHPVDRIPDGLVHPAALINGGGSDGPIGMVREGVLQALRAFAQENAGLQSAGGVMNASYNPGGGLGGGGYGGRGGSGGAGGGYDGPVPLGSKAGSLTSLIEEEARRAGIDPRIMEGMRAGESLHRNSYDKKDDALESSWGPFQLNRRRGLGVTFEHDTGLDLRNSSSIAAQARWVAQYLKRGGSLSAWSGFHGPRDANPRWGESGYVPNPQAGEASGPGVITHPLRLDRIADSMRDEPQ